MPEQNLPTVRYRSALAAEVADLWSSHQDLLRTEAICERLVAVLSAGNKEADLADALWTAALVRYARCFTTGKRQSLSPELVSHLPGDPIAAHNYYKNQRDKLIAHSVNPFEESLIGLVLSAPEAEHKEVLAIVNIHIRLISDDQQIVRQLGALAREFRRQIQDLIERRKQELLAEANGEPLEALYKLEPMQYTAPGPASAAKGRT